MPDEVVNQGISSNEADSLLSEFGKNTLPKKPPPSRLEIFIRQLKSPLVYILLAAGIVTAVLGEYSDTVIISIAVITNTILGYIQENRANRALHALQEMIHPEAVVIRDKSQKKINAELIVPGDIVMLKQGDKVPADGVLIYVGQLYVTEALLTGESVPVEKKVDQDVFMGTIVTSGLGYFKVTKTGAKTEMGEIALSVQDINEDTPLKKQLRVLSNQLSLLVVFLTVFVFVVGILRGKDMIEIFTTAVALAVSAIPEGLLIALTVILAIGMQRILRKKGLVRNLVSAETLGGVTTICVDKTGTLTEGEMKVSRTVGDLDELARQTIVSNDLDDPMVLATYEWAQKSINNSDQLLHDLPRVDSMPFSSVDRYSATLHKTKKTKNIIYVNGAPDYLIRWTTLSPAEKKGVKDQIEKLTSEGMRVIGLARKHISKTRKKLTKKDIKHNLEWVGLLALTDPVRSGVAASLEKTKLAGVRTIVITGDYPQTALSVMKRLNIDIPEGHVILGEDLERMSVEELSTMLKGIDIALFARTTPQQKLKIVDTLKRNGEVVAMTGDGVNDAPALAKSDIGIVVGSATDVAKESSDLVLLDSSFETIVEAIEEGRAIFDNIRKVILNLLCDAFEEIVAVIGTLLLALPLPVTAVQVLWINLISDGFPSLALTVDPKRPEAMRQPPRDPKEKLVSLWMRELILIISVIGGLLALAVFTISYRNTGDITFARSMAFATLGVNSLAYVFSIRALTDPVWSVNPFSNPWIIISVIIGLIMQVAPFYIEFTQKFLEIQPLSIEHWAIIASVTTCMFLMIEVLKSIFRMLFDRKGAW